VGIVASSGRAAVKRTVMPARKKPLAAKRGTSTAAKKRKAVQLWGEYIHARDVFCQRCGKTEGRMNAHHVMVRRFAATFADPVNGILLCKTCHDLMHDDPHEALIFYSRRFGVEGYQQLREKAYGGAGQVMRAAFWDDAINELTGLLVAGRVLGRESTETDRLRGLPMYQFDNGPLSPEMREIVDEAIGRESSDDT
jgi:hypothetical protein